jgi:hypothetical protein
VSRSLRRAPPRALVIYPSRSSARGRMSLGVARAEPPPRDAARGRADQLRLGSIRASAATRIDLTSAHLGGKRARGDGARSGCPNAPRAPPRPKVAGSATSVARRGSIRSVCLVNIERSAGLIDDGRHECPILTGLLRGVRTQRSLVLENLALRHQLVVARRRETPQPRHQLGHSPREALDTLERRRRAAGSHWTESRRGWIGSVARGLGSRNSRRCHAARRGPRV